MARSSSELTRRVLSSVVMAAVALGSAWLGGWVLAVVWFGAALAVASEWLSMTRVEPRSSVFAATGLGLAAIQAATVLGSAGGLALVSAAAFAIVAALSSGARNRSWAVLGLAYSAAIATAPVLLREHGVIPLLWLFAVVWTTDVAAFFVGRAVGGPKLWPAVSPKKTWSGFLGGMLGATLVGVAVARAGNAGSLVAIAILSCAASVASQGGDFAESAMKRRFGVKDSGHLIPGHGGFMDRLDGFVAVCVLVLFGLLLMTAISPRGTASW